MTVSRRAVLAVLPVGLVAACTSDDTQLYGPVRIATGSTTAVYWALGNAIAELIRRRLPHLKPTVLSTNASAENIDRVLGGSVEMGFTQADIAGPIATGSLYGHQLTSLARLYDDYVHLVVRAAGPIHRLTDVSGHRISIGSPGSGTAITANELLAVGGQLRETTTVFELTLDGSVTAFLNGSIDGFFFSGGLPVAAIRTLATKVELRMVPLGDFVQSMREKFGEYYVDRVLPASTYLGVSAAETIGIPNYLVVRSTMSDTMAYSLTKLLFDGQDVLAAAHPAGARLNIRSAIATPPLALHPGAARYYRHVKE
jgi:TRAP transporter TAXI family solute receptor